MSTIREHLDLLEFNNLSEDDQRELAHMVLNNMHQDLEEWAQLRELDMGKIKKWIRTGALAAALAGAGITAAHAGNFNDQAQGQSRQQQTMQHSQDQWRMDQEMRKRQQQQQPQAQQRQQEQPRGDWQRGGGGNFNSQPREQPRGDWSRGGGNFNDRDQRAYQQWHEEPRRAREFARQQGGWEPHPRWHQSNPWFVIGVEPPREVLNFVMQGQNIMFIPHPRQIDLMRAREMGGMIETLEVPYWPDPIRAFVYEMDGVVYITALPGQLP